MEKRSYAPDQSKEDISTGSFLKEGKKRSGPFVFIQESPKKQNGRKKKAREEETLKHSLSRFFIILLVITLLCPHALAAAKLEKGSSGTEVTRMQTALQALGYQLEADGKYGPATVRVVKAFQRDHGLTADGVAGVKTLTLLYQLVPTGQQTVIPTVTAAPSNPGSGTATVVTTGGALNLRDGASATARVIGEIPNGDMVIVVNRENGWAAVIYNGMAGYVMTEYLVSGAVTPIAVPTQAPAVTAAPSPSGTVQALVVTTGGSLNLRQSPSAAARVLAFIPYGTWVTVSARGQEWSAVSYGGQNGYVMSKFLSFGTVPPAVSQPTAIPAPTQAPVAYQGETAYVNTTGGTLNLREGADGSARVLTVIPNGTQLPILSRGSVWCMTIYQGQTGYVMTSFLRFAQNQPVIAPTALPTAVPSYNTSTATVHTGGGSLNLREQPRANAKILTTIPDGTQLQLTSRDSAWCGVRYLGYTGYVMTAFLVFSGSATVPQLTAAPTPASSGKTAYTALITTSGGAVNLRQEASSAARVLSAIPNAASVTVYSRGETWSQVSYNGVTGYVMTRYLTFLGSVLLENADAEDEDPSAFTRTLKKGMTGQDVAWVQNRLMELGYLGSVSNVYDDATFSAVKAFQSQNGLTADGLAGSQTFSVLKSENARKAGSAPLSYTTLRIDNTGSEVRALQTDLSGLGYPVTVNGTYDVATHNAVVAFQQRNGLVISGIADALTRQVLHGGGGKPYSAAAAVLPANEGWIAGPQISELKLLHWTREIKPNVKAGQTFTVFDPNTNLSWKLVFYSLGRHADSQPASWRDTQIMNRSFGDTSWTIHPVYVLLPTGQWTLATMHNRPHLYGSITDNGFGGHLCVHFLRDMEEAQKNDPNYGVNNQVTLRNAWKALTGETVN